MNFQKSIFLTVRSGSGGKGCSSFSSSKRRVRGGPDGGDGGRGGNIILQVNEKKHSFSHLKQHKVYQAENGKSGGPQKKTGKKGDNLTIEVPPGTWIKTLDKEVLLSTTPYLLLKGGRGGRGNNYFKNSVNQAPVKTGSQGRGQTLKIHLTIKKGV